MLKRNLHYLVAAALLWLLFAQAARGAVMASITFDEGPHLAVGYATLRTGDFRLQPIHIHPPLTNVLSAAPLLLDPSLPDPRSISGWDIASLSAVTDAVVWKHTSPDVIALAGRLPIILMAILLGAFVYRWAADLAGRRAGLLALFLYVLDPNIIAHAQVITTDMGVTLFGFIAFYLCFRLGKSTFKSQPSNLKWTLGIGAAVGAALVSKVTAGLMAPLIAVMVLLMGRGTLTRRIQHVVVIGLTAFVVVWATYGFEIARVPGLPVPIPAATHVEIYQSLQQHYDEGHPSFLMGMNSTRGWWYYFFVAFLVKTPLPTLILLVASVVMAVAGRRVQGAQGARCKSQVTAWTLGLFPVVHFATALWSSVDIGYRHLLPILPFLFVFIGAQVAGRTRSAQVASSRTVSLSPSLLVSLPVVLLLAWYSTSAALIFPHNLAYFNEIAGGPDGGYNWLVDSNLDWGQNLKELKTWLDAHGISRVYLSQFSPARPDVYGLEATMLPPSPRAAPYARFDPAPGWYALGATTLQGSYLPDANTYAWFRSHKPVARLGHALFIYEVKPRQPALTWAAICADPAPLLSPEEVQASFGRSDLRTITLDCHQSWIYPAGNGAGAYVMPPGVASPPSATLEAQARDPNGKPSYNVYRVGDRLTPPSTADGQMDGGPLTFLGYRTDQVGVYPGNTVELWTFWQVKQLPNRPLSLLAHMIKPDGTLLAVGDGLGVPSDQWQIGDVIVQHHQLLVPPGTPGGSYSIQTGVYWLDTMERWPTRDSDGQASDRLTLAPIAVLH